MNTIAERIKFAMNVRNVKQVEMVQRTGITKGAFSSYLSGNYNPKKDKLELIADALDININWLMGENVPMENSNATDNQTTGYVFYKEMEYLLNDKDTAYIGFQTQYGALIPFLIKKIYFFCTHSINIILVRCNTVKVIFSHKL